MNRIKILNLKVVRNFTMKTNPCYNKVKTVDKTLGDSNKGEDIKQDYVILGKYLNLFDTKRLKHKEEKLEERQRRFRIELKPKVSKKENRVFIEDDFKSQNIKAHVKDTIDEILSSGLTPNSWFHPLFWQVANITINPTQDKVFIEWKARDNNIYEKEQIEASVKKDLEKFKIKIQKNLKMYRKLKIKISPEPFDMKNIEDTLYIIEQQVNKN